MSMQVSVSAFQIDIKEMYLISNTLVLEMALEKERVCVTGAGGFLASWVVKLLLSRDYFVHGTAREPSDEKNARLYELEKASENLKLFKADLLDYDSVKSAIMELLEPAVKGTLNVVKACLEAKVKRVIVVSSGVAVGLNPRWPKGQIMDETCWSDKEYCRTTNNWYCLSKTEAESEALEFGKKTGLDVVTICPNLVLGPLLQSKVNTSSLVLIKLLKENSSAACPVTVGTGVLQFLNAFLSSNKQFLSSIYTEGYESLENKLRMIVDVRDVAEALLLAYEKAEAEGRYICTAHMIRARDLVDKLKSLYPNYNYPKSFTEKEDEVMLTSEKLQKLGWSYRSLEETLVDSVESYKKDTSSSSPRIGLNVSVESKPSDKFSANSG
ncbi:Epimerase domain-containing protein [Citrus sinensis]|uniref:Epimerase domain-containing protein n=1 Tax=Citrus sinensis TaxID=2711 RepID=A0ACB8KKI1_CITSI|nr:Epimerase domain-containing protein [Citrus sinensis]